jgi:hypothetical protein
MRDTNPQAPAIDRKAPERDRLGRRPHRLAVVAGEPDSSVRVGNRKHLLQYAPAIEAKHTEVIDVGVVPGPRHAEIRTPLETVRAIKAGVLVQHSLVYGLCEEHRVGPTHR